MAHVAKDRVKETTTTTGTGALTLAGAVTGFRAFSSVMTAPSDTCFYCIDGGTSGEWEVGIGTYSASNTLTRTSVLASSNSNNAVSLSAGSKSVFITAPGDKFPANTGVILTASDLYTTAYSSAMNGVTNKALVPDVVYDKIEALVHPGFVSTNYYNLTRHAYQGTQGATAAASAADTIYYFPFWLDRAITITDLGARVITTSAGGVFKLAVYANGLVGGQYRPTGTPVAETGDGSTTSGASVYMDISNVASVTLNAWTLYWAAYRINNTTARLFGHSSGQLGTPPSWYVGSATAATVLNSSGGYDALSSAETYANAWPDASSETFTEIAGSSTGRNIILLARAV